MQFNLRTIDEIMKIIVKINFVTPRYAFKILFINIFKTDYYLRFFDHIHF